MRVVHAAALATAAILLASIGSAQGIGAAAAREREKRNTAPAKPAKVYTDGDLGASIAAPAPDLPADTSGTNTAAGGGAATPADAGSAGNAGSSAPAEGAAPNDGSTAAPDASKAGDAAAEAQAKAQSAWKKRLDQARQEEQVYKDVIDKLQLELNDTSGGFYNPGRASKISFLEENKTKLAAVQSRIAALEEEGRRNRY